jgi:predicted glycoside hydrolase/deacetylase ChbG (UPF0249 family)
MLSSSRKLIVNADDFGLSSGVNEGVAAAHENGIVTSASLMVRWPAAAEAAAYARSHPGLSVGLHLDLGEWIYREESWQMAYAVVSLDNTAAVEAEISRQFQQFVQLMGREPAHLDSHQHVHETEPIRTLCLRAARTRGIVLRNIGTDVRYCGRFYGQSSTGYPYPEGISVSALVTAIQQLPTGVTELACHPARRVDMDGMYRHERLVECATLIDPVVRAALDAEKIILRSFQNWHNLGSCGLHAIEKR